MHAVEPPGELTGFGRVERDPMRDEVTGGPLETLLDRLLAHQQGPGDFRGPEPEQRLQGQGELVLAGQPRMATGKDHPQLAVLDLRFEKQHVQSLVVPGASDGPLRKDAPADRVVPQRIDDLVPGDAVDRDVLLQSVPRK